MKAFFHFFLLYNTILSFLVVTQATFLETFCFRSWVEVMQLRNSNRWGLIRERSAAISVFVSRSDCFCSFFCSIRNKNVRYCAPHGPRWRSKVSYNLILIYDLPNNGILSLLRELEITEPLITNNCMRISIPWLSSLIVLLFCFCFCFLICFIICVILNEIIEALSTTQAL